MQDSRKGREMKARDAGEQKHKQWGEEETLYGIQRNDDRSNTEPRQSHASACQRGKRPHSKGLLQAISGCIWVFRRRRADRREPELQGELWFLLFENRENRSLGMAGNAHSMPGGGLSFSGWPVRWRVEICRHAGTHKWDGADRKGWGHLLAKVELLLRGG